MAVLVIDILSLLMTISQVCAPSDRATVNGAETPTVTSNHAESTPSTLPATESTSSTRPATTKQILNSIRQQGELKSKSSFDDSRMPATSTSNNDVLFTSTKAIETYTESSIAPYEVVSALTKNMHKIDDAVIFAKSPSMHMRNTYEIANSVKDLSIGMPKTDATVNYMKDITVYIRNIDEIVNYNKGQTMYMRRANGILNSVKAPIRRVRDTSAITEAMPTFNQQSVSYNVSNLSAMCPYASICNNQRKEIPTKNKASCCLPCSCDTTCSKIGNCCYMQENIGSMCHSHNLKQSKSNEPISFGYFMIDKCLDGSDRDCTAMTVGPWGSLYPVYNYIKNMNYYNSPCAKCNGAESFTHWEIDLECEVGKISNGNFLSAIRGQENDFCVIKFAPPKAMDIQIHGCSDTLISRCNITGRWEEHDAELEEACALWYSPVILYGQLKFANVYCQLCNGYDNDIDGLCIGVNPDRNAMFRSFALSIDYRLAVDLADTKYDVSSARNGGCGIDMVKHVSKPECRPVLCPEGFVGAAGKCQALTSTILNDGYYIQIQLTPVSGLLPTSYIKGLSKEQILDPVTWFDTNGAQVDCFALFYRETANANGTFVKDFVARVGKTINPIRLKRDIKAVQNAISKQPWAIRLKGVGFQFSVSIYRYESFIPLLSKKRYDVLDYVKGVRTREGNATEELYETVIPVATRDIRFGFKKTHFCNRVRLARSEWIAGFQEIRLNTSKEVFYSKKMLGDSEFDVFLDDLGEPTVEICVEDFNPDYWEQQTRENNSSLLCSGLIMHMLMIAVIMSHAFG